ncbi:MAG: DUF4834 family protein [Tannerella sp.]|jgi:hypothetical protein|nr:DUF4834 family protein [Tannerella sp.]
MFKFLFFIFFFVFILASLLGFSVIRSIKSFFFGEPKSRNRQRSAPYNQQRSKPASGKRPYKKIIPEEEGEYVDYEEIKE